jgi:hypothetical protein
MWFVPIRCRPARRLFLSSILTFDLSTYPKAQQINYLTNVGVATFQGRSGFSAYPGFMYIKTSSEWNTYPTFPPIPNTSTKKGISLKARHFPVGEPVPLSI